MTEPEEAYELALLSPENELVELSIDGGNLVAGPREDSAPGSPRSSALPYRPILATLLLKLLNSAQQALTGDYKQADKFIARATALISAEVQYQSTAKHSLHGRPGHSYLAPWQIRRVIELVETNLARTIRIEELAQAARLSVSHFSKAFRVDFGQSPHGYIVRRRIERAQEMMLLSDEPLALIAVACGLADQSHLTRLFHRLVGASPGNWRRSRHSPVQ